MINSFKYELEFPIKVAVEGKNQEGIFIEVKSPRPRDGEHCMVMEATFTQCIGKGLSVFKDLKTDGEATQNKETEASKADSIMSLIMMGAEGKDIISLNNRLRELLCEGNVESPQATVECVKFTKPLFDEIHYKDKKALLGRYISSFLSSSLT